jgi:hypothetical protein
MNATTLSGGAAASMPMSALLDQELMDSFRSAMLERKRVRGLRFSAPLSDSDVDEALNAMLDATGEDVAGGGGTVLEQAGAGEVTEMTVLKHNSMEAPVGVGYHLIEPKKMVGGLIPDKSVAYAYSKVLQLRAMNIENAGSTVEPTEYTLEEFVRIEQYNLELVERKVEKKKV